MNRYPMPIILDSQKAAITAFHRRAADAAARQTFINIYGITPEQHADVIFAVALRLRGHSEDRIIEFVKARHRVIANGLDEGAFRLAVLGLAPRPGRGRGEP